MPRQLRALLDQLLVTHSPSGEEGEMEALSLRLLKDRCDEVWTDPNGNIIARIAGKRSDDALLLTAHKDEIGTIVRKIEPDGKIWLEALGGCVPWVYGEGPFDVLGTETVTGILSVGSRHSSHLSPTINDARSKALTWEMCYIDCKLNAEQLAEKGIRIGVRACVARSRKTPVYIGDCVGGYALDDKAAVAILLRVADRLKASRKKPAQDVYLAITGSEETGIMGGAYVSRTLPATRHIAVEIAPIAPEYDLTMSAKPVIFYKDAIFVLDKAMADELSAIADKSCGGHQRIIVRSFGSDATTAVKLGFSARVGCVGFATQNTHGYELGHLEGMENCGKLLAAYALER